MVDSIGNIGGSQGANLPNRTQNATRSSENRGPSTVQDELEISGQALNLAQAQQATTDVRAQLSQNFDLNLGLAEGFDEQV